MNTTVCPSCKKRVTPTVVGEVEDNGNYEYKHSDCPLCGYIFKCNELNIQENNKT